MPRFLSPLPPPQYPGFGPRDVIVPLPQPHERRQAFYTRGANLLQTYPLKGPANNPRHKAHELLRKQVQQLYEESARGLIALKTLASLEKAGSSPAQYATFLLRDEYDGPQPDGNFGKPGPHNAVEQVLNILG